jgi:hypothetical protein
MTYEKLLEKVYEETFSGHSERAAEEAFDFAEENEISPAMQDELEEAVQGGAKDSYRDPETELHFYKTELELLVGERK